MKNQLPKYEYCNQECQFEDGTGASTRKGIWNLLIKYNYVAF